MQSSGSASPSSRIYDDASGGQLVHSESFNAQPIVDGDFVVYLGSEQSLDLATFRDDDALWIEITVAGEVIEPRLRLATAPYAGFAQYCGDASSLEGLGATSFASASHGHAWSELSGIPADLANGDDDTLADLGVTCVTSDVARFNGTQWECGPVTFASIDWPSGYSFLTIDACPAGFTAVESGYLKLSSSPSLVAASRTLAAPGHYIRPAR